MPDVLVLYASKHGHTEKVATRVAAAVEAVGATVKVHDVASPAHVEPSEYDAVIVGASIHAGHHQHDVVDWVTAHHTALNLRPSAFFSVCLTAADDTDESRAATRRYLDEFLDATGWIPSKTATFAGALQYREYDFATRLLVRLMMRKAGHPTDVTQDYDYTDWNAVERFAREFAGTVAGACGARAS
jgi:menaquinone-dependent protoporphyrinogen oxidase